MFFGVCVGSDANGIQTSEVITLLYKLTLKPTTEFTQLETREGALNPTRGVMARAPEALRGLTFRKDASRAGGGVYVAAESVSSSIINENPEGTFVRRSSITNGSPQRADGHHPGLVGRQYPSSDGSIDTGNVNPDLNAAGVSQNVQVLNMLQHPGDSPPDQVTVTEHGFLEGLPQNLTWGAFLLFIRPCAIEADDEKQKAYRLTAFSRTGCLVEASLAVWLDSRTPRLDSASMATPQWPQTIRPHPRTTPHPCRTDTRTHIRRTRDNRCRGCTPPASWARWAAAVRLK